MLRNIDDLYGFSVVGSDGPIGEFRDCYFDDHAWTIRFFVVETGTWLCGRKVLISPIAVDALDWSGKALSTCVTLIAPRWIDDISWLDATVSIDLTRQSIKDAPPYDAKALPNPEQEHRLFEHYGRIDHANLVAESPFG